MIRRLERHDGYLTATMEPYMIYGTVVTKTAEAIKRPDGIVVRFVIASRFEGWYGFPKNTDFDAVDIKTRETTFHLQNDGSLTDWLSVNQEKEEKIWCGVVGLDLWSALDLLIE